jgi:hypothetical protein
VECVDLSCDYLRTAGPDQWAIHVPIGKLKTERMVPVNAPVCSRRIFPCWRAGRFCFGNYRGNSRSPQDGANSALHSVSHSGNHLLHQMDCVEAHVHRNRAVTEVENGPSRNRRPRVAGAGNGFTVWILRHFQRKRGATARPDLRNAAPVLDPTGIAPGFRGRPLNALSHGRLLYRHRNNIVSLGQQCMSVGDFIRGDAAEYDDANLLLGLHPELCACDL